MRIVTAEQMRQIEQKAFAGKRAEPLALMARAGQAVAAAALATLDQPGKTAALVLVGPGNNGGDGLVIAEALTLAGLREVTIWLYGRAGLADAPVAADLLDRVRAIRSGTTKAAAALTSALAGADLIIDAIYGIGARDSLPDDLAAVLERVNERTRDPRVRAVAVDVPTGVNADTGAVAGAAFKAGLTVTLGRPKRGLYLPPGLRYAGRIAVEPIGLEEGTVPDDAPHLIGREEALRLLPRREADAHKGDAGSLLIVGGSGNYLGAPVLAAHAALRAGVGLLTLAVPRSILGVVAAQAPEATYLPLPEAEWGTIGREGSKVVAEALGRYTALQIGNGIGREDGIGEFLGRLFGIAPEARGKANLGFGVRPAEQQPAAPETPPAVTIPVLFDADGLNWLSTVERWWETLKGLPLVLTPHAGELARLRKLEREAVAAAPWEAARDAAREWGQTVVLKGGHSVVATPDGALWVTPLANPALASAGTGDTLAGIIGGFLAQGLAPADAAVLGLWVGARAGELARDAIGTLPLIAGDLPRYIAAAIRELEVRTEG